MRAAPEELNLSANQHAQDATTAEFFRSYRTHNFPGAELLQALEAEEQGEAKKESQRSLACAEGTGEVGGD